MKISIRSGSADKNGGIDFKPVFEILNDELTKVNKSLELICAGGYVMQLHGYAATADVDAFYDSNAEIEAIIRKIGDEFGINRPDDLWLNNSISNLNRKPSASHYEPEYKFSNLIINIVDLKYVVGMKLECARTKDLEHVASFLKHENNEKPFELLSELTAIGFRIDISVLLEAYGQAHGMDWLAEFYQNNESQLEKYY